MKQRYARATFMGLAFTFITTAFALVYYVKINASPPPTTLGTVNSTNGGTVVLTDVPVYKSIEELTKTAEVIVVGGVVEKGGSRNLARNPADPKQEALDRKTMSQEYKVIVEEWIKGTGQKQIDVVYPEYTLTSDGERINEPLIALKPGHRYVLFLRKGILDTYYGVGEPWQFQLLDGKAQIQTAYEGKELERFTNLTENELLRQVRQASK